MKVYTYLGTLFKCVLKVTIRKQQRSLQVGIKKLLFDFINKKSSCKYLILFSLDWFVFIVQLSVASLFTYTRTS